MSRLIDENTIIKMLNTMDRYTSEELTLCDTDETFPKNEVFIVDDVFEGLDELPSALPEPCEDAVSRQYILGVLAEYIDEYGEVDAEGNHDPKWCAMKEAEMVVKEAPSVEPEHDENDLDFVQTHKRIPVQLVVSSDCISRQAAIDAVCKAGCGSGFCGVECDEVLALRNLPPAQPEHDENDLDFVQPHKRIPVQLVVSSDCISRHAAIDALGKHKTLYEADHGWDKTTLDALDTAISALKAQDLQPTCNQLATDAISRKAAIEAICTEGTRLERNGTVAMVEIKQWCVDILEALPSAQPESTIAEILNTIAEFKKFTHTDEILIVQKHGMKVWDEDGVEYELQPTRIYCKDCRHRDPEDHKCDCGHDILWQLPRDDRWYCADAERKEGEADEADY